MAEAALRKPRLQAEAGGRGLESPAPSPQPPRRLSAWLDPLSFPSFRPRPGCPDTNYNDPVSYKTVKLLPPEVVTGWGEIPGLEIKLCRRPEGVGAGEGGEKYLQLIKECLWSVGKKRPWPSAEETGGCLSAAGHWTQRAAAEAGVTRATEHPRREDSWLLSRGRVRGKPRYRHTP